MTKCPYCPWKGFAWRHHRDHHRGVCPCGINKKDI